MKRISLAVLAGATASLLVAVIPAQAAVRGPVRASGPTPFATGCNGAPQSGTNYLNAEVEPYLAANPRDRHNLVAVWQQDRWSTGGSNGLLAKRSTDGGRSW